MEISIKALKFELDEKDREYCEKKLERIRYAEDLIVDLIASIKFDKQYTVDTTVNFRWGTQAHVSGVDYDLKAAFNKMMDVLDQKVKKEKDKIQER